MTNHWSRVVNSVIPNVYASGEKEKIGELTNRGNKLLRSLLIESAWMSVRNDSAMTMTFNQLRGRMESNKAIIRIARKLISRVRHILITKEKYQYGIINYKSLLADQMQW